LEVLFDDTRVVKWNKLPKATCAGVTGSLLPLEANLRDDMIANAAVALIGIGLLAIGALAIAAPETAALMFGVPTQTTEARAYVWATATRDVAIGCWFLVLLALRVSRQALSASLIGVDTDWRLCQRLLECGPEHHGSVASRRIKRGLSRVWRVAVANRFQQIVEEGSVNLPAVSPKASFLWHFFR
jgi:hypothetical protein